MKDLRDLEDLTIHDVYQGGTFSCAPSLQTRQKHATQINRWEVGLATCRDRTLVVGGSSPKVVDAPKVDGRAATSAWTITCARGPAAPAAALHLRTTT